MRRIGVVVPTYREVENIPQLVERLRGLRQRSAFDIELVLVDDDSRDGTVELVRSLAEPWLRLLVRSQERDLSQAVLEGLRSCHADVLVVMDADLSHPPEKIEELVRTLDEGADFALGSRFVEGGSTADDWGVLRWFNSRLAAFLALPLTRLEDPLSGFFALRRATFEAGRDFNPVGYKIGLELLVKCGCRRPVEIPIHFSDRRFGESKLTLREQLRYLQHLRRLYVFKYGTWSGLVQFLVVGLSGVAVNLAVLSLLLHWLVPGRLSVALAIWLSMTWNFALERRLLRSRATAGPLPREYLSFVSTRSLGAVVNYATTLATWDWFRYEQLAALLGIAAGAALNLVGSRYLAFRRRHVAASDPRAQR